MRRASVSLQYLQFIPPWHLYQELPWLCYVQELSANWGSVSDGCPSMLLGALH